MAFSEYVNCDLKGDEENAIRIVNQEINDLVTDIDNDLTDALPDFASANIALKDLLEAIDNLMQTADNVDLNSLNKLTDSLGIQIPDLTTDPIVSKENDEERLSLSGLAVVDGTILLQNGTNVDEIRKLINIVGFSKAEEILNTARIGSRLFLITKPYYLRVGPIDNKAPSIDYINSTYGLNISESDVTYITEGQVQGQVQGNITRTLISQSIAPQQTPTTAIVHIEQYIGKDITLKTASSIAGIPEDHLFVYVFNLNGAKTTFNGKAQFQTIGFNGSTGTGAGTGVSPEAYKIGIKVGNNEYEIDITGNEGASESYDPVSVAATINYLMSENLEVISLDNELVFRTKNIGATSSLEFITASDHDASKACGIIEGLKQLIAETSIINHSNVTVNDNTGINFSNNFTGVKAELDKLNPLIPSDLPQVIIRGGNPTPSPKLTINDVNKLKLLGLSGDLLTAASHCKDMVEQSPDTISDYMTTVADSFNRIVSLICVSDRIIQRGEMIDRLNRASVALKEVINTFNIARSLSRFFCVQITNPDLITYLKSTSLSDSDIENIFLLRYDIHGISSSANDSDVANKISELLSVPSGSSASSSKKLNESQDQYDKIKKLFNDMYAQLLNFSDSLTTMLTLTNKSSNITYLMANYNRLCSSVTVIIEDLNNFNTQLMDTTSTPEKVRGFNTYDSPGSLIFRTINPSKTFNILQEVRDISEAVGISTGTNSGTQRLLTSIGLIVDNGIKQFSVLNSRVQDNTRNWIPALEIGLSAVLNLIGGGSGEGNISKGGFAGGGMIKCAFSSSLITNILSNLLDVANASTISSNATSPAITELLAILRRFIQHLLCKIQQLLDKVNVNISFGGGKLPFHCEAQLKIGLDPSVVELVSRLANKLSIVTSIYSYNSSNLSKLSIQLLALTSNLSKYSNSVRECDSDSITQMYGPNGEITTKAEQALDSYGSIYPKASKLVGSFSLPNPPKNLEQQLQRPQLIKLNVPKA